MEVITGGEIPAAVLSSYERGEHAIPAVRLCLLADLYAVSVDELTARNTSLQGGIPPRTSRRMGDAPIRLDLNGMKRARGREAEAVAQLVHSVQGNRRGKSGESIVVRHGDLEIVAAVVGKSIEDFVGALTRAGLLRRPKGRPPKTSSGAT